MIGWAIPRKKVDVEGRVFGESFLGPMWKRKSQLASRGMIEHGTVTVKGEKLGADLWFESRWSKEVDFDHLFDEWTKLSRPEIGMLHVFSEREVSGLHTEAQRSFELGSFGGRMKPGLPNIGWAMVYGKSYATELDAVRIKDAGFRVEEGDGYSLVRVTESLSDVVDNFEFFSRRRAELKSLFKPGLFWISDEPEITE